MGKILIYDDYDDDEGVTIPCQILEEREKAIYIWRGRQKVWIPRLCIYNIKKEENRSFVRMNRRMAESKKLIIYSRSKKEYGKGRMFWMKCLDCNESTNMLRRILLRNSGCKPRCKHCGSQALEIDAIKIKESEEALRDRKSYIERMAEKKL